MPLDGAPISQCPLPEGWSLSEIVDDVVDADGLAIRRVGLCATSAQGQAVGSAADVSDDPTPRATFELLERIALLEASHGSDETCRARSASGEELEPLRLREVFPPSVDPDRWGFARSSGVSLHTDWTSACNAAAAELIERDRLLRAWLGETVPQHVKTTPAPSVSSGAASYDWRTYVFPPSAESAFRSDLDVVGVFGFPKTATVPIAFGFAARPDREDAVRAAQREARQLLAFLWGEPIPERAPDPAPTPMTHLETYQVRDRHSLLLRWLEQGHAAHHQPRLAPADVTFRFADLTPPWLKGQFCVAKALCRAAIPLVFGQSPLLAHLPPELRIHPIP